MTMRSLRTLLLLLVLPCVSLAAPYEVTDSQTLEDQDGDRLALAIHGPEDALPTYKVFIQHKPERFVIELNQAEYSSTLPSSTSIYKSTLVKGIRTTLQKNGSLHYILDLNYAPASFNNELLQIGKDSYLLRAYLVMPKAAKQAKMRNEANKLITPTELPGIFELKGPERNKTLKFDGTRRTTVKAKDFISLFDKKHHPKPVNVTGAAMDSNENRSELTLDLSGPAKHSLSILQNPLRAVIDIQHAHKPGVINDKHLSSYLTTMIHGKQHRDYLRIIIDLPVAAYLQTFIQSPSKDRGNRLIVRITRAFPVQHTIKKLNITF